MRHILHPHPLDHLTAPPSVIDSETYQTKSNPSEHSKSKLLRLTLVSLWNLRVPPMLRAARIALLLVPFLALSAGASRVDATRLSTHAPAGKSSVRRAHRPAHSGSRSAARSSKSNQRAAHSTARATQTTARRHTYSSTAGRHTAYSSRSAVGIRRARYTGRHAQAHFTPLANVPLSSREKRSRIETDSESQDNSDSSSSPQSAQAGLIPSFETATPDHPSPAEGDTAIAAATTDSRNPRAASPVAAAPGEGQVAELQLPHFPQNLHLNSYALRGNHDSLVRQNERSVEDDLERIEDDADLQDRIARGMLVRVPESAALSVNPELPADRRYCRTWTANFLTDLSHAHGAVFHKPLVVSSAVRTVEYQKHLMRVNRNAADAEGDVVSPHLTGATIDIAKSGLSRRELQWMRGELLAYQNAGVIDVEEEFRQRCFHITVYKNYDTLTLPHKPASDAATPALPTTVSSTPADTATKDE